MIKHRILCTGNPEKATIARGIKEIFPEANFASLTAGYNLTFSDESDIKFFNENIQNYNVLINSSYIDGNQEKLLQMVYHQWKYRREICHIFNIGSIAEYDNTPTEYSSIKLSLRKRSLNNQSQYFRTTHIILGGIKYDDSDHNVKGVTTTEIAKAIKWILESEVSVPLIQLQADF